jgi:Tfp pilus assembly protein PilZ
METTHTIAGAPEVKIAVRVRGLSHEERYFDELASTTRLTQDFIVIRLRERVDPDSELHITNMRTQIGGTYRVAWINTRAEQGLHAVGLELLDAEGVIWKPDSIPVGRETGDTPPVVLLECQKCHQRVTTPVPEAETESLREGFIIARPCDACKATTGWVFAVEKPPAAEARHHKETASAKVSAHLSAESANEHRVKGRAPIRLAIKIIRNKNGSVVFDIGETINVSRTGAYFATNQGYEVGGDVKVIIPYHPDSMAIPVQARVVRQDEPPGTYQKRVAIHLTPGATV